MVAKQKDDETLSEVKVILQGLQQLDAGYPATVTANEPGSNVTRLESLTNRKDLPQRRGPAADAARRSKETAEKRSAQRRLGGLALATIAACAVILLAADMFLKYWPASSTDEPATARAGQPVTAGGTTGSSALPAKPAATGAHSAGKAAADAATAVVPPAPPDPAIANARQMMDSGKIRAARELLQHPSLSSSRDGAWLIARSFDPAYLATTSSPDAAGDKEKAAGWYRRWRDIGAQNGVPMDDNHFRRLIETLD